MIVANIILLLAVFILVVELSNVVEYAAMKNGSFRPLTLAVTVTYIVAYFTFIR